VRRRLPVTFGLLALLLAGAAAALALAEPFAAAICAALAGMAIIADLTMRARSHGAPQRSVIERVMGQVERGRRLVIYERDTGLFAYWYLELRGNEECDRARRYGRDVAVVVIEPNRETDAWETQERLRIWLRDGTRQTDIAGYLGNGRYVVIMPEADRPAAEKAVERMKSDGIASDAGIACFPMEGEAYEELYRVASSALPPALRHAAA
jgi:GGDEF domain-containing protein